MALKKEVFKSKVLQKLYPAVFTLGKEQNPLAIAEELPTTTGVQIRTGDAGKLQKAATSSRRMYTVLPPPPDFDMHLEKSVTLPQLESVNNAEYPAEGSVDRGGEEEDAEQEPEDQKSRKRRRRKKKRPGVPEDSGKEGAPVIDSSGQSLMPVDERGEHISRNKKRKLKKKRHKEKLLSLGLMPRAAALEFTYSKDGEEEEEEEDKRKAAELSEFLSTTLEIYTSDSSPHVVQIPHLCATVDGLLKKLAGGSKPTSLLNQLYGLKKLVQQNMAGSLEEALAELNNGANMSAEETNAVVSLFRYWITEILPMQRDKAAGLSTTQQ